MRCAILGGSGLGFEVAVVPDGDWLLPGGGTFLPLATSPQSHIAYADELSIELGLLKLNPPGRVVNIERAVPVSKGKASVSELCERGG